METSGNKFIFTNQEVATQTLIATSSVQTRKEALQETGQMDIGKEHVCDSSNPVYPLWNK